MAEPKTKPGGIESEGDPTARDPGDLVVTAESGGADEGTGDLGTPEESGITAVSEEVTQSLQLQYWVDEIIQMLGDLDWDLRPEYYDEALEAVYISDFLDVDTLLDHMLELWYVRIEKAGPAYRVILSPRIGKLRSLETQGRTPITTLVNILYRYMNEFGMENIT